MKKILISFAVMGLLSMLSATPQPPAHKILWCHYPPGLLGPTPEESGVIIINIDVAADGTPTGGMHLNHTFDGPANANGGCAGAIG